MQCLESRLMLASDADICEFFPEFKSEATYNSLAYAKHLSEWGVWAGAFAGGMGSIVGLITAYNNDIYDDAPFLLMGTTAILLAGGVIGSSALIGSVMLAGVGVGFDVLVAARWGAFDDKLCHALAASVLCASAVAFDCFIESSGREMLGLSRLLLAADFGAGASALLISTIYG